MTKHTPNRRRFLQWGFSLGLASAAPLALLKKPTTESSLTPSKEALKLKLGGIRGLLATPELRPEIENFTKAVSERSHGEVEIEFSPEHWLSPRNLHSALQSGAVDVAVHSPTLHQYDHPAIVYFGAIPVGLSAEKKILWLTARETSNLWSELYQPAGLKPLFFGCGASSLGQISKHAVESLSDLKNLSVCSRDSRSDWYEAAGLRPVSHSTVASMARALTNGTLDLSEPLQHSANLGLGLHRLGRHYYQNNWLRSSYTYELMFSKRFWDGLPASVQTLLEETATQSGIRLHAAIAERENRALDQIASEGTELKTFPNEVIQHFELHSRRMRDWIARADSISAAIHQSYSRFESRRA